MTNGYIILTSDHVFPCLENHELWKFWEIEGLVNTHMVKGETVEQKEKENLCPAQRMNRSK